MILSKVRNHLTLLLVRGLGVGLSALGSIHVARALGPEKLGISTFIFGFVMQAGVLIALNQDNDIVRRAKSLDSGESLDQLISEVFSYRLAVALCLAILGVLAAIIIRPDPIWYLAIACGIGMLFFQGNHPGWLLQLHGKMARYFTALSLQGMLTGGLALALIRPDWAAGCDLAVGLAGSALTFFLAWRWALQGRHQLRLGLSNALAGLRRIKHGKWLALMGIATYLISSLEITLIGTLCSIAELGQYRAAMQMINLINPFLPLLFMQLYPDLIDLENKNPSAVFPLQRKLALRTLLVGAPVVLLAVLVAPHAYPMIFGAAYAAAALPFVVLLASKLVSVGVNIFMWGVFARRLDHKAVFLTFLCAGICIPANFVIIPRYGAMGACAVNLLAQSILLVGYAFFMRLSTPRQSPVSV